jgi:hypothetical protein
MWRGARTVGLASAHRAVRGGCSCPICQPRPRPPHPRTSARARRPPAAHTTTHPPKYSVLPTHPPPTKRRASDGHGTMTFANGDEYVGEWRQDLRHGRGSFTFAARQRRREPAPLKAGPRGRTGRGLTAQEAVRRVPAWRRRQVLGAHCEKRCTLVCPACCRYKGVWEAGVPRCGAYCEVRPAPPGAPGSLPCVELAEAEGGLQAAAGAVGGG